MLINRKKQQYNATLMKRCSERTIDSLDEEITNRENGSSLAGLEKT